MRRVVLFAIVSALATVSHAASNEWRVMPVRTQGQYNRGEQGGLPNQWMQGAARSKSNPNIIYLSHDCGGMWRSDDGGLTWGKPQVNGLYLPYGQSIEVDPVNHNRALIIVSSAWDVVHASYTGLYLTTDGGDNWTHVKYGPVLTSGYRRYTHTIAWAPSSVDGQGATVWYAALYNGSSGSAVYRSSDRGATWTTKADISSYSVIHEVQVSPTDANLIFLATSSGLRRSTDGGTTLTSYGNLPSGEVTSVAFNPTNAQTVYAVVQGSAANGLYRSTNGGVNFTRLSNGNSFYNDILHDARRISIHPTNGNVFYVIPQSGASSHTAIRTTDAGSTWSTTSFSLYPDVQAWRWGLNFTGDFSFILMSSTDSTNVIAQSGGAAMYRTTDGTTFVDSPFEGSNCSGNNYSIVFDPSNSSRFVASFQDIGTYLTENGANWFVERGVADSPIRFQLPWYSTWATSINPSNPNDWIAAAGTFYDRRLIRTTDSGQNWSIIDGVANKYFRVFHHPTASNYVFAGDRRSTNSGSTWASLSALSGAQIVDYCHSNPDIIYAVDTSNGIVKRSTDRGNNWSTYVDVAWSFGPYNGYPAFSLNQANCNAFYSTDSSGDLAYYNGSSWSSKGLLAMVSKPSGYFISINNVLVDPSHPEVVYATIHGNGVSPLILQSVDSGATWRDVTYNKFRQGQEGLNINPNTGEVMIGTCSGTWVLPPPYPSSNGIYDKLPSQVTPKVNPIPNPPFDLKISWL